MEDKIIKQWLGVILMIPTILICLSVLLCILIALISGMIPTGAILLIMLLLSLLLAYLYGAELAFSEDKLDEKKESVG